MFKISSFSNFNIRFQTVDGSILNFLAEEKRPNKNDPADNLTIVDPRPVLTFSQVSR